ncbi:hypothetical protein BJ944DRAFT_229482 [Cunninghamella echinulata]|nr:hypothetical protein BJ944DRAFT_229482 [Cunninghamella echinulata]
MASIIDPSPLTYLCSIQQVNINILELNESIQPIAFISSGNDLPVNITVPSQASAYLLNDNTITFPHPKGGLWSFDCSSSNPDDFLRLQDILTFFIKFENQHNIKNTLVMMNPNSCQITQVIADNVYLGKEHNGIIHDDNDDDMLSDLADDDFITTRENYYGQKLPVSMDESVFKDGLELRRVRLINQTSHCMDVSSDWVARGLIRAGDTIAGYIQSGSSSVKSKVEPSDMQLVLSRNERHYLNFFYNITTVIGSMTGRWISRLFSMTSTNIQQYCKTDFRIPTPESKLGNSALQAASRIMEGTTIATKTVFSATRESLIQVVQKKYGHDAGFLIEKLMGGSGNGNSNQDILVYFDGHGISRKVVMQQYQELSSSPSSVKSFNKYGQQPNNNNSKNNDDTLQADTTSTNNNNNIPVSYMNSSTNDIINHHQPLTPFGPNDLFHPMGSTTSERQVVYDIDESNDLDQKKEQLVLV